MNNNLNTNLQHLSDSELLSNVLALAVKEGLTTQAIIVHLIEVNRRGLYREQGYSSLKNKLLDRVEPSPVCATSTNSAGGVNQTNGLSKPIAVSEYKVTIAADEETAKILAEVQKIRGKKESLGALLKVVLKEYVDRHSPELKNERRQQREKRKATTTPASVAVPVTATDTPKVITRHIPEAVRDAVRIRDGYRCCYVSENNVRCQATRNLQFDHIKPFGRGGGHSVKNIRLLCPQHNLLMAELAYGKKYMDSFKLTGTNLG